MNDSSLQHYMAKAAAACVRAHPELDSSSRSLVATLDRIVGATGVARLDALQRNDGPTLRQDQALCLMYGGYLGELIRRDLGGVWMRTASNPVLVYRGAQIDPIGKVSRRLLSDADNLTAFVELVRASPPWSDLLREDLDARTDYTVVLIVPRETCQEAEAARALEPVLERARDVTVSWWWIDDVGSRYSAAVWWVSANRIEIPIVDEYLTTGLTTLRPVFAYFSIFGERGDRAYLRRIFQLLEPADWSALLRPAYERMFVPHERALDILDHPKWLVIADEEAGLLISTTA